MVKWKTGENVSYKCLKEQFDIYLNMPDIPNMVLQFKQFING